MMTQYSSGKVYKLDEINGLVDKVISQGRIGAWITKNDEDRYAVIVRTLKNENGIAEQHDKADDIYYIIDGQAKLVLNGKLFEPKAKVKGEFIADAIDGGNEHAIEKGDIVEIPRGTPHQIICDNSYLQYLSVKVYSGKAFIPDFATELHREG